MSVEMNERESEHVGQPKCEVCLAGAARSDDEYSLGFAESFDFVYRGHYENTTGGDSKMKSGLRFELYAPAA
jgi:hypothetical protein